MGFATLEVMNFKEQTNLRSTSLYSRFGEPGDENYTTKQTSRKETFERPLLSLCSRDEHTKVGHQRDTLMSCTDRV